MFKVQDNLQAIQRLSAFASNASMTWVFCLHRGVVWLAALLEHSIIQKCHDLVVSRRCAYVGVDLEEEGCLALGWLHSALSSALVHHIGSHIGRQSLSPIFPLIISSAKYPPVSNWSNRPSYLRGRQQLFMDVLFMHWAQVLVRITLWLAGWAPPTMLWIGIPSGALQWKDTKAQLLV